MGQICFVLVALLCYEIYTFPLGEGLPHTKDLITQHHNINLETRARPTAEGKNQEEWIVVDPVHLFQLRISSKDCCSDLVVWVNLRRNLFVVGFLG